MKGLLWAQILFFLIWALELVPRLLNSALVILGNILLKRFVALSS
jgi:hypothetical protein